MIEDQKKTLESIEKDRDNFVRERKQCVLSNLPTCSKCHLKEGHNRLNCPYPNPCSSSIYCKNIDKHPDDKQTLKDLNKKLGEERKRLSFMKEELKNKEKSCESVRSRYVSRVKETLIASNPEKYVIDIDGKTVENWRIINKDSKILEQEFRGKIPSPQEARKTIMSVETLAPHKTRGKTSVHKPYKKLWESQGVSWPKPSNKSSKVGSTITRCDGSKETHEDAICSPQRKKTALARNIYQDDYTLALGIQNSYDTLPDSFDLDAFERMESTDSIVDFESHVDEEETQPLALLDQNTVVRKDTNNEESASASMGNFSEAFECTWNNVVNFEGNVDQNQENTAKDIEFEASVSTSESSVENISEAEKERNKSTLNLYALAEAALEMLENDS